MEDYMKRVRIIIVAFLFLVSFGIAGGCDNGNGGGNGEGAESPEPMTGVFDLETAINLAELSLVAYNQLTECIESGKNAISVPSPYTLEEVIYEGVSDDVDSACLDDDTLVPAAFIATEGNSIYLSFRGTSNLTDAVADAAALQVPYTLVPDGGEVSLGFLNDYMGTDDNPLQPKILSKLDELIIAGEYENLYITGHSLGAALAALAFPDLSQNVSISNVFMYNFAGPAVGNSDFVNTYEGEYSSNRVSCRVVNTNDLVPKLPPLGLDCTDFMYEHVSGEHEITFGVALPALPDFAADDCDLLTIGADLLTYGLNNLDDIETDHRMCTYFNTLCMMGLDPSGCADRAIGCGGEESP